MFGTNPLKKRLDRLEERLEVIERTCRALIDDTAKLEDQHVRLRGKVYAHRMHKETTNEEPTNDSSRKSRDQLRRELTLSGRIMPGKPVQHE